MTLGDIGKTALALTGLVIAVAITAYDAGRDRAAAKASQALRQANTDAAMAQAQADAYGASLQSTQALLVQARQSAAAQQANAQRELSQRQQLQQQLDALRRAQSNDITKVGHEDPTCADLARLPVCPAVSDRLWPQAGAPER